MTPPPSARLTPFALLAALAFAACAPPYEPHGTLLEPPMQAPPFALASAEGPVEKADFEGKVVVMFFGFTACPDVCPDTLARLARARRLLTPEEAEQVQVVLVSVDPDRDTPAQADGYAKAFDPSFIGLTGTPQQIAEVAAGYGIYYGRTDIEGGGYTVDHTAATTVLNRRGETVLIWPYGTEPEALADDLRFLLGRS